MKLYNWYKNLPWSVYHGSFIAQGILQICVAIIVSCVFPVVLENSKADNNEKIESIRKKEEMYMKFCSSFSLTLTLNDEMRACHKIISCENDSYYKERCRDIVSKGGYEFASMKEPLDVVCNLAGMYYSDTVAKKLSEISKNVSSLLSCRLIKCNEDDLVYSKLFKALSDVDYPLVVEMMRREIVDEKK